MCQEQSFLAVAYEDFRKNTRIRESLIEFTSMTPPPDQIRAAEKWVT